MIDRTERVVAQIEAMAIERDRIVLRQLVRSMPTYSEDGLWVKTQVLRLLGEKVTAVSDGPESAAGLMSSASRSDPSPTAALNRAEVEV